ncbi:MAG TPA: hypothetical protein VGN48_06095 [Pedococcus sp.]|jgi:hypothetical protein|nr:hypothetical protein [Pedococcus sp.]
MQDQTRRFAGKVAFVSGPAEASAVPPLARSREKAPAWWSPTIDQQGHT